MTRVAHKTCNLCEATCGLRIEVESNRVVEIRPDKEDLFSRGHMCAKAIALKEIQEDPDRLRRPVRRTPEGWEEVSWEEAFEEVVSKLAAIQREHGPDAVGTYLGNPGAHDFGTVAYLTLLYSAIGSESRFTASSLDQNPKHASSLFLFGNTLSIAVPDVDRTDFLLVLGGNPVVSNGSLMTAPGFRRRARELRERGGTLVVVDPRRTETAELADRHHFIRPGSDGLLLAALIHTILEEGLARSNSASERLDGQAALVAALAPFSPEAVAARTGIAAEEIRGLARDFAAAPSAVCYGRVGIALHPFATLANWLVDVLNAVTGNLDSPGGAMWTRPAADLVDLSSRLGGDENPEAKTTRVRGAPGFNGELPSACLAEEIRTPGPGQIRGMLTLGGNPVLSAPDGVATDAAFEGLDYFAAVDLYINETTRHANLILPPRWSLEQDNYEIVFHLFAVRNTAKFSPAVLEPPENTRASWQIHTELALRWMRHTQRSALARAGLALLSRVQGLFHPRRILDWMIRLGPHGDGFRPWRRGLRVRDLLAAPGGIDLGPLRSEIDRVVTTPGGRIDLARGEMLAELRRLAAELASTPPAADGTLQLIGRRDPRTNNSWLHNVPVGVKGRDRCVLIMHSEDAAARKLTDGDTVWIRSRVGEVRARLRVSDELMPGVVSLPHGWGHHRSGMRLRVASAHAGSSLNDLLDAAEIEPVVGNAVLNGQRVEVLPSGPGPETAPSA